MSLNDVSVWFEMILRRGKKRWEEQFETRPSIFFFLFLSEEMMMKEMSLLNVKWAAQLNLGSKSGRRRRCPLYKFFFFFILFLFCHFYSRLHSRRFFLGLCLTFEIMKYYIHTHTGLLERLASYSFKALSIKLWLSSALRFFVLSLFSSLFCPEERKPSVVIMAQSVLETRQQKTPFLSHL